MSDKDVLDKADKLIEESRAHEKELQNAPEENNSTIPQEKQTNTNKEKRGISTKPHREKKRGYRRQLHYKKPSWWLIAFGVLVIIGLIYLIAIQLPYIPM